MVWLPGGKKSEDIFIRFDTTHERDRQTDRHRMHDGIGRAYASHRAAKTEHDINERTDFMPIGTIGPRDKGTKRSTSWSEGQKSMELTRGRK